jgi:F-type H+-transporting ATPase subunit b
MVTRGRAVGFGRLFATALLFLAVSFAGGIRPAAAQEHDAAAAHAEGGEEHKGGLPQLNVHTFPSQIFWLFVSFGTMLVLMSKVGLPRVGEVLQAREAKISADLESAGKFKDDADALIAAYEQALAKARSDAQSVLASVQAEGDAERGKREAALSAELASRTKAAEERIAAAKQVALGNVQQVAADVAREAASKLAGVAVEPGVAETAVAAAIKERT